MIPVDVRKSGAHSNFWFPRVDSDFGLCTEDWCDLLGAAGRQVGAEPAIKSGLAAEMGLGKTIQAIAIAYFYKEEWPLLIVVPSSLRCSWTEEIEKWIPELEPEEINVIQNKTDVGRISTSKVTVLGYGLLTTDALTLIDALNNQNFKVVIVDESHYMKSRTATRTKILLPVVQKSRRAILLTGTPALGRPEELFMQIEALFPQKFGTWTDYAKRYCNARIRYFGKRPQWDYRGASNLKELHHLLNDIMIRRLKTEVLTQLPPKIRQHIPFDLPDKAAKDLNTSLEEWKKLMRSPNPGGTETVLGLITRIFKQTAIAKVPGIQPLLTPHSPVVKTRHSDYSTQKQLPVGRCAVPPGRRPPCMSLGVRVPQVGTDK
ncbi:DNA annealing helicase and endonuclease ZRANB3-like [Urocitellus parryii]